MVARCYYCVAMVTAGCCEAVAMVLLGGCHGLAIVLRGWLPWCYYCGSYGVAKWLLLCFYVLLGCYYVVPR